MMRSKELDNYETLLPKMHPLVMCAMEERLARRMKGDERPWRRRMGVHPFLQMKLEEAFLYTDEECDRLAHDMVVWMFRNQIKEAVAVVTFADSVIQRSMEVTKQLTEEQLALVKNELAKTETKIRRTFGGRV
jgi:hypothetical protein